VASAVVSNVPLGHRYGSLDRVRLTPEARRCRPCQPHPEREAADDRKERGRDEETERLHAADFIVLVQRNGSRIICGRACRLPWRAQEEAG